MSLAISQDVPALYSFILTLLCMPFPIVLLIHEALHYLTARVLRVEGIGIGIVDPKVRGIKLPIGLIIHYVKCPVYKYLITASARGY